jgi:predicted metal-binding protein
MSRRDELERLFEVHGYQDFQWIDPQRIVVAQWVRMKCMYGCHEYGSSAVCPPNVPSVNDCERFFREYTDAVIFHFEQVVEKPEDRHAWSREVNGELLKLEREVFITGHPKAFLLFMDTCEICRDCSAVRAECRNQRDARPTPEALAVDVFSTVKHLGFPIQVLPDYEKAMNRYALLMID